MIGDNFSAKLIDFGDSLIEGESDKKIDDEEEKTEDRSTATDSETFVEFKAHDGSSEDEGCSPMSEY